jgi:hypothetical protein
MRRALGFMVAGPLARSTCALMDNAVFSRSLKSAANRNQDTGSDKARNQIANPTAERDTDQAEQPTSDRGPYDAEHDVHQETHLTLHELLGEPAVDGANYDGCDPTDLLFVRRKFKAKVAPIDTQLSRPTFAWFRADSNMRSVSVPITVPVANAAAASYTHVRLTFASYLSGKLSGLRFQTALSIGRSGRI